MADAYKLDSTVWNSRIVGHEEGLTTAKFSATIPPIMSGIKTGGDGMRVQFDIPETDMNEAVKLVMMRGCVLRVTVEIV